MKHSSPRNMPPGRRPRATAEERQGWIQAWEESRQTQAEFAAEHGLSVGTLRNWLRRASRPSANGHDHPKFVEVDLERLVGPKATTRPECWEFEIRTPGGWVVAVAPGTAVERLRAMLEAVGC